jgi:hypothetical protein
MNVLNPLFELQYPQWMMMAGAVLVVIGFFGFAFDQNRNVPPDDLDVGRKTNTNEATALKVKN